MSLENIDPRIEKLVITYSENRDKLFEMIEDIEAFKDRLDTILPTGQMDARFTRYFEEKIKAITSFFSIILDIRKEINKSLREEIDLRRGNKEIEKEIGDEVVRALANRIDKFKKKVKTDRKPVTLLEERIGG